MSILRFRKPCLTITCSFRPVCLYLILLDLLVLLAIIHFGVSLVLQAYKIVFCYSLNSNNDVSVNVGYIHLGSLLVENREAFLVWFTRVTLKIAFTYEVFLLLSIVNGSRDHIRGGSLLQIVTLGHWHVLEQSGIDWVLKNVVADGVLHFLVLALCCAHLLECLKAHSLNTKTVGVVQLGGEPVLTGVVRQGLEVVTEILINLNFISVLYQVTLLQAASEEVTATKHDAETDQHEEHRNARTVCVPWRAVVISWDWHSSVDDWRCGIVENLFVTHDPVAESEIQ